MNRCISTVMVAAATLTAMGASAQVVPVIDAANLRVNQSTYEENRRQTTLEETELENMETNTERWRSSGSWSDVGEVLGFLAEVSEDGPGFSYARPDVDGDMRNVFPEFAPSEEFGRDYELRANRTLATLRQSLAAASFNLGDAEGLDSMMATLQDRNVRAAGRQQTLQVSNQLASHQVEELARLRALAAAAMSAQNVYFSQQLSSEATARASLLDLIRSGLDAGEPERPVVPPPTFFFIPEGR